MKIGRETSLETITLVVGKKLRERGIRAVLTGGACASLYSAGAHSSLDADFVLTGEVTRTALDDAMASIGFRREVDRYVHPDSEFFVEFVAGPLAIGRDHAIRPARRRESDGETILLTATDSCRDRLAAFYHWNDRQSLGIAVVIAILNRVRWNVLERWSRSEGQEEKYGQFVREVRDARRRPAG